MLPVTCSHPEMSLGARPCLLQAWSYVYSLSIINYINGIFISTYSFLDITDGDNLCMVMKIEVENILLWLQLYVVGKH